MTFTRAKTQGHTPDDASSAGKATPPKNNSWRRIDGITRLPGVGFAMSLGVVLPFAFDDAAITSVLSNMVILGSVLTGLAGNFIFRPSAARGAQHDIADAQSLLKGVPL